ncbi:MAG: urease accessory protein UreE [Bacillota bacterium]|nr:urease accessory protein UreE [Bacillota bacterium]
MILVENICENINSIDTSDLILESVSITHEETLKVHRKFKLSQGREIAISLPAGDHLHDGDVLYRDHERVVFIQLIEEKIIHISPDNDREWAKAAYNIGNMHQPAYLKDDGIYVPYDEILLNLIKKLGVNFEIINAKLDGERAAVTNSGHHHDHHHHHHSHEE